MKHEEIIHLADKIIDPAHREAAKAEFLCIIKDGQLEEIDKVHYISVAEMHILNKCNLIRDFKDLLYFICMLKEEIITPHLAEFIKEYMSLENGQIHCSPYVERKLGNSDFYPDSTGISNGNSPARKAKIAVRVAT